MACLSLSSSLWFTKLSGITGQGLCLQWPSEATDPSLPSQPPLYLACPPMEKAPSTFPDCKGSQAFSVVLRFSGAGEVRRAIVLKCLCGLHPRFSSLAGQRLAHPNSGQHDREQQLGTSGPDCQRQNEPQRSDFSVKLLKAGDRDFPPAPKSLYLGRSMA